jgi:hypothetical protein
MTLWSGTRAQAYARIWSAYEITIIARSSWTSTDLESRSCIQNPKLVEYRFYFGEFSLLLVSRESAPNLPNRQV